jgi:hypothetical protein
VGESAYWHVARRRWRVVVAFAELGVGAALVATAALDSARPLRDVVIGLAVGLAVGLFAVRPADQLIGPATPTVTYGPPGRRRSSGGRHQSGRQQVPVEAVLVRASLWPEPELSELPAPTFARPRHRRRSHAGQHASHAARANRDPSTTWSTGPTTPDGAEAVPTSPRPPVRDRHRRAEAPPAPTRTTTPPER